MKTKEFLLTEKEMELIHTSLKRELSRIQGLLDNKYVVPTTFAFQTIRQIETLIESLETFDNT